MEDHMLRKLMMLFTALIVCNLIVVPAGHVQASANGEGARGEAVVNSTTESAATSYEPDNTPAQAKLITSGATQTRAIIPKTDVDWITFQLTVQSAVVLETNGPYPSDTRMRLFRSKTEIEANDDDGPGFYAFIDRECGVDPLPAGTYYIKIEEYLNNTEIPSYNLFFQSSPCPSEVVDIFVGNLVEQQGSTLLSPNGSVRRSFTGVNKGPVKIVNTSSSSIIAAERLIYKAAGGAGTSFSELMGLPANQLHTTYWLPWYNSKTLNTQLRIANVSATRATVQVFIGGVPMAGSPFSVAPGVTILKSYTGIDKGPVKIQSNVPIVASERVIYKVNGVNTSYSELMAMPASQVDTTYWLPWYNNKTLNTQLRIANVSGTPGSVSVSIGGAPVPGSPFPLAVGASLRKSFTGIDKGPVLIESNVDIVAAERVIFKVNNIPTSYSEMMAMPNGQLNTIYWLPWYNNLELNTQLRIANASGASATVQVYVGGQQMIDSPFTLPAGASIRKSFTKVNKGPVQIVSTENIVAAERVIYTVNNVQTSFSEMMALPESQLDTIFWLPWYDNVNVDTQLRIGMP
jgi:uncharacterized protein YcfL